MGFKKSTLIRTREKTPKEIARDEWNRISGAFSRGGKTGGEKTFKTKTGFHNPEIQKIAASLGGNASIEKLLQWQKDNDFRVGDLERTDEWKLNQSLALKKYYEENPMSIELRIQIGNTIRENNSKLSDTERSKKFSNDSATRKAIRTHTDILNTIPTDIFITHDARKACEAYGLGNWKGFLKNINIIKQIHKGTNKNNPSIYQKIK